MRRFAGPLFVFAAFTLATPAAAQIAGRPAPEPVFRGNPFVDDGRMPGPGIGAELRQVRQNIERARDNGFISRREARQLRRETWRIESAAIRYASDGLSGSERDELAVRTQAVRGATSRSSAVARTGR
jgi:hypothetical protein